MLSSRGNTVVPEDVAGGDALRGVVGTGAGGGPTGTDEGTDAGGTLGSPYIGIGIGIIGVVVYGDGVITVCDGCPFAYGIAGQYGVAAEPDSAGAVRPGMGLESTATSPPLEADTSEPGALWRWMTTYATNSRASATTAAVITRVL